MEISLLHLPPAAHQDQILSHAYVHACFRPVAYIMEAKKLNSSRHVDMATDFFNNATGPRNHHTQFESFPVYC